MPFLWDKVFQKGLHYVSQLYENGQCISMSVAQAKYGLSFMQFNSLMSAIPKEWRMQSKKGKIPKSAHLCFYEDSCERACLSKNAYAMLTQSIESNIDIKIKQWEVVFQCKIQRHEFLQCFKDLYVVTNVPKLRSFQFRLLHRAIVLNTHLYGWGLQNNNLCTFCGDKPETYVHIFVFCQCVQELWLEVEKIMEQLRTEPINFNTETVICNCLINSPDNIKNFICLLCKQYIYRQRCLNKELSIQSFIATLWQTRSIERFIATKNNKTRKFNKKWRCSSSKVYFK